MPFKHSTKVHSCTHKEINHPLSNLHTRASVRVDPQLQPFSTSDQIPPPMVHLYAEMHDPSSLLFCHLVPHYATNLRLSGRVRYQTCLSHCRHVVYMGASFSLQQATVNEPHHPSHPVVILTLVRAMDLTNRKFPQRAKSVEFICLLTKQLRGADQITHFQCPSFSVALGLSHLILMNQSLA